MRNLMILMLLLGCTKGNSTTEFQQTSSTKYKINDCVETVMKFKPDDNEFLPNESIEEYRTAYLVTKIGKRNYLLKSLLTDGITEYPIDLLDNPIVLEVNKIECP